MKMLLDELYKTDIQLERFYSRKESLEQNVSYEIVGISQSGKSGLAKSYLATLKKGTYLYINCDDLRLNIRELNEELQPFCIANKISTLVLDNYKKEVSLPNVNQLIITSELSHNLDFLNIIKLYPLSYEEFLAYEHKYDSSSLKHFFLLGGFIQMHKLPNDERVSYVQKTLKSSLDSLEIDMMILASKLLTQKVSAFMIYERLKGFRKISKDRLYSAFEVLYKKGYIHQLAKFNLPKAPKKLYLCDISIKYALSVDKHFSRVFENMVFLEILKASKECYYDDGIDFYLPKQNEVVLAAPFAEERAIFKKIESIEAFLVLYQIKKISVVTMNSESEISHPVSKIEILPFDTWALGE